MKSEKNNQSEKGWRLDLLKLVPPLKWFLKRRWFQFSVVLPTLLVFIIFLIAGLWGSPVGNANIIVIFVWILWWFFLIGVMVPFFSRMWCTLCPFPFFGDWLQRGTLTDSKVAGKEDQAGPKSKLKYRVGKNEYFGKGKVWPKRFRNIWLQNVGFLLLCTFSALFLTRPIVSVLVLGSLFVIATLMGFFFRQRAFCMYICPVSGFLSLYSMSSMLEVRSKSRETCDACKEKGCLTGNEKGWGCPWFLFPSTLDRNNYCGLCMECIKTCPYDNMTVRFRPIFSDRGIKGYDEAWKAFIMLAIAVAYSFIYLGPWGFLKDWANIAESRQWLNFFRYTGGLWLLALVIFPAIHGALVWIGKKWAKAEDIPYKSVFLALSYSFVPFGLFIWIVFSLPLMFINGSYILITASDPMGWGWNLLGAVNLKWTPIIPQWMPLIQLVLIVTGLIFTIKVGWQNAQKVYREKGKALKGFIPLVIFFGFLAILFFRLYAG